MGVVQYVASVLYVAWLARRYYWLLDLGKELPPPLPVTGSPTQSAQGDDLPQGSCQFVEYLEPVEEKERIIPVEDLVLYRPGVLLGGAGATINCMHESPEKSPPGYMVAVDVRSGTPIVSRLSISSLPEGVRFQPHGIFYSKKTERLYTINHGGVTNVGSRVEVFDVISGEESGLPSLQWRMAVGGNNHFSNLVLNSVVEGSGDDEVYLTQFQNFAIPDAGEHHPSGLQEKLGRVGQFMLELLAWGGFTGVHHCKFDIETGSTVGCSQVVSGFVHANGLTINEARNKLWVNDPVRRSVTTYSIEGPGELNEIPSEHIALPHAADNIHFDEKSGHLFAGTLPLLHEQLNKASRKSGTFLDVSSSDGTNFATFKDLIVHDGKSLNQMSACYKVSDWDGKEWGVCGSPLGYGLLACRLG